MLQAHQSPISEFVDSDYGSLSIESQQISGPDSAGRHAMLSSEEYVLLNQLMSENGSYDFK
jgi:hypothetical protein